MKFTLSINPPNLGFRLRTNWVWSQILSTENGKAALCKQNRTSNSRFAYFLFFSASFHVLLASLKFPTKKTERSGLRAWMETLGESTIETCEFHLNLILSQRFGFLPHTLKRWVYISCVLFSKHRKYFHKFHWYFRKLQRNSSKACGFFRAWGEITPKKTIYTRISMLDGNHRTCLNIFSIFGKPINRKFCEDINSLMPAENVATQPQTGQNPTINVTYTQLKADLQINLPASNNCGIARGKRSPSYIQAWDFELKLFWFDL